MSKSKHSGHAIVPYQTSIARILQSQLLQYHLLPSMVISSHERKQNKNILNQLKKCIKMYENKNVLHNLNNRQTTLIQSIHSVQKVKLGNPSTVIV